MVMALPVRVKDVVDSLQMVGDLISAHLNRKTGEIVEVNEYEDLGAEDEPMPTLEDVSSEDGVQLPSQFDLNEWSMMERFAHSQEDENLREDLLDAIRGSGGFRRFKSMTARRGIRDAWFKFHEAALTEIAIEFLEENHIPYTRD